MNTLDQGWLNDQCQAIEGVCGALLLMRQPDSKTLRKVGLWPENNQRMTAELVPIAKMAISQKKNVSNLNVKGNKSDTGCYDYIALPIHSQNQLKGVISLKVISTGGTQRNALIDGLHEQWNHQQVSQSTPPQKTIKAPSNSAIKNTTETDPFYSSVVRLASSALEYKNYGSSSRVLISELASFMKCERVAIGILKNNRVSVTGLSNSAEFDQRSNLARNISEAMYEAVVQDDIITFSKNEHMGSLIDKSHADLADQHGSVSICTIPLMHRESIFGAITLERSSKEVFSKEEVRFCEQLCALMGPYLALMRENEGSLATKIRERLKATSASLFGMKNLRFKFIFTMFTFLLVFVCVAEGDIHIKGNAIIEGKVQRVVAAPMDGYVTASNKRAGDIVEKGDLLAILDDKELELQHLRLSSQRQKLQREFREAMAKYDRAQMRILSAQIEQTEADVSLIDEQLARTQITAPFDGIIIDGDLTQSLASPVSRGEVLFKIAPLEGYRIILNVDESSIVYVKVGQTGLLALASLPGESMPMVVEKITPVAQVENGKNTFRVEASLDNPPELLRPGMRGAGRIQAGKATYIWLWTHDLIDWLRLWIWSWKP